MRIGFIGLGNMGAPMAANLAKAGHEVSGFDLTGASVDGVLPVADSATAARGAEVVLTMLPHGAALEAVAGSVLQDMDEGSILIDCSTVEVKAARAVAKRTSERGIAMLDAPVSGGTAGAAAGSLTFMVGGPQDAFETARGLFEIMGARAVYCGAAGSGQAAKICNNMILGATMAVTCEAFALAERLGLEPGALYDVVSTSSGQSWSVTSYCPMPGVGPETPADNNYRPGFAAALMLKDLKLSQDAAQETGADTPLGKHATEIYEAFVKDGDGDRDFSALIEKLRKSG